MKISWMGMGVGLLFWPGAAFGQLDFETTFLEAKVDPSEDSLTVRFPFSNGSDGAVSIEKIESSCGCLKASADITEIAPGGKGVVTGVFSMGTRVGTFEKTLTVKMLAAGKEHSQNLRVQVEVPRLTRIQPQLLQWEVGEALSSKEFLFEVVGEVPIRVKEVSASREGFRCEIEEVEDGKKYRVRLTPNSTEEPLMGIVRIETDCEIEKFRTELTYFAVNRAADGGSR